MSCVQNRAGWYHRLMQRVASWGVATVQYDTPFVPIITVASELQLFPHLVEVRAQLWARSLLHLLGPALCSFVMHCACASCFL
jgi:hypothetical protein